MSSSDDSMDDKRCCEFCDNCTSRRELTLAIYHSNDAESQVVHLGEHLKDFGGVARFATLLEREREAATRYGIATLTVHSGNTHMPSPEFSVSCDNMMYVTQYLKYDALTVGSHDFDWGPEFTSQYINSVDGPPFVSSNLNVAFNPALNECVNKNRLVKHAIIPVQDCHGYVHRIGAVGAITPNLKRISSPGSALALPQLAALIQEQINILQWKEVYTIILLSHLDGIEEDRQLIAATTGISIAVSGSKELLANPEDLLIPGQTPSGPYPEISLNKEGQSVALVTTNGKYGYLGKLVVTFDKQGEIRKIHPESGPLRVSAENQEQGVPPNKFLLKNVVIPVQRSLSELTSNIIATISSPLNGVRRDLCSTETNWGNLIADAIFFEATTKAYQYDSPLPQIAVINGGSIRNDSVFRNSLTQRDTFDALPFNNLIAIISNLSPSHFKLIMENAVSKVEEINDRPFPSGKGSGRFAQISGFTMTYDISQQPLIFDTEGDVIQPGQRIKNITLNNGIDIVRNGKILLNAPNIVLATNSFLSRGGDQYSLNELNSTNVGSSEQHALFNYLTYYSDRLNDLYSNDSTQRILNV